MSESGTKANQPGLAAVFSFLFSGLGQIYNGQILKGLVIIFVSALSLLIFIIGSICIGSWLLGRVMDKKVLIFGLALILVGLICVCTLGIYSIVDAYRVAAKR